MIDREQLHQNGYLLLRQAVPADWLDELRATFEAGVIAPEQWPVPRGLDWRHALVDLDARVQAVCRLPALLAVAGELIGEGFFLAQVEGREPLAGGGHQVLHRDLSELRLGDRVTALVYLDDYGPANGATRIVPGSHRPGERLAPFDFSDESRALQLAGKAGDVLLFDADLVHGACRNPSGARRRSLLISYFAESLYASQEQTASLRNVQMDTRERFDPKDFALVG
ncbi:phytanoyl-CoA dioxygenase family protein [Pseudomonas protegens]|uniref:phytanoyl-CoA dioxygenase family protein n=1 Tax=Pseudomonas protegens TaxID=380021 RepID=UPI000F4904DF|nr:phytanoyl-CoA dioxygenase family protein [Pseudomonas protegens]ROL84673.1 phytanoyl-CoA dioxygenase [Pseudomonas protegens]ROM00602.1 phytanoyl-CoA dioxygenase [Pseudomonas protegens]ROM03763.1 phytanoyl-CoA dioxygenase [Pseudomonas protegens]ROM09743.1 phytanoyl-CoA dioxygenase [Pseudomonas protegens]